MPNVIALVFWVWVIGAVVVLAGRVYGRATGKRKTVFEWRKPSEPVAVDGPSGDEPTTSASDEVTEKLARILAAKEAEEAGEATENSAIAGSDTAADETDTDETDTDTDETDTDTGETDTDTGETDTDTTTDETDTDTGETDTDTTTGETDTGETETDTDKAETSDADPSEAAHPLIAARATNPDYEPIPDPAGLAEGELHPAVLAAMRAEQGLPASEPDEQPAVVGGLFDPANRQAVSTTRVNTMAPLTETLRDIEMPCDLAPLTELGPLEAHEQDRERVVMWTMAHGAGEVAAKLADELERIGLTVTSTGVNAAMATRGKHAAEIRIHEFPDTVSNSFGRLFPRVHEDAVVVEFYAS